MVSKIRSVQIQHFKNRLKYLGIVLGVSRYSASTEETVNVGFLFVGQHKANI